MTWGISPNLDLCLQVAGLLVALTSSMASGAYTEPRLALMRVTAYHSTAGRVTLKLEGSFSFADALQLGLPINLIIVQGSLKARLDLAGNVFTSAAGGAEQAAPGPGVVGIGEREITLVLPSGFAAGNATAQVVATYDGQQIASNQLSFLL